MAKLKWKPGTMLYPVPAVMITCGTMEISNIITVAWAGTINTNPAMVSFSIRKERYSYDMIIDSGEFVINLTTKPLVYATDYCGVVSGRNVDKFNDLNLTKKKAQFVNCPLIAESPLNIECKVKNCIELGSHDLIIAEVLSVNVDENLIDSKNKLRLDKAQLIAYSHGAYYELGNMLGTFGYSVKKTKHKKTTRRRTKKG